MSSSETFEPKKTGTSDPEDNVATPDLQSESEPAPPEPRTTRRRGVKRSLATVFGAVLLLALAYSFVGFADRIASLTIPENPRADAIVVWTGGTERVAQAVRLLAEERARRLLISGVHPGTTVRQIASSTGFDTELFDCCIDLDRAALNTEGNAIETAAWVERNDFTSLLLVTSAYHLPRASAELQLVLPGVRLVPYPVYSADLDLKNWYRQPATIRLLLREYVKYTVASLRIVGMQLLGSLNL